MTAPTYDPSDAFDPHRRPDFSGLDPVDRAVTFTATCVLLAEIVTGFLDARWPNASAFVYVAGITAMVIRTYDRFKAQRRAARSIGAARQMVLTYHAYVAAVARLQAVRGTHAPGDAARVVAEAEVAGYIEGLAELLATWEAAELWDRQP